MMTVPDMPIVSSTLQESALSAFRKLRLNKVSALAVLNNQGALVGSILIHGDDPFYSIAHRLRFCLDPFCLLLLPFPVLDISVKDLRLIAPEVSIIPRLYLTIAEFLARVHRETTAPPTAVVCSKEDTVLTVLRKIFDNKVHRVWVVDSHNMRPTGVVSLRDLLMYIFVRASERNPMPDSMDTS